MTNDEKRQEIEARIAEMGEMEQDLVGERVSATEESVAAIRKLEGLLGASLAGDKLRGCPNLTPDWGNRTPSTGNPNASEAYFGWRVRGFGNAPLDRVSLAGGGAGAPRLVLNQQGRLVMAHRSIDGDDRRRVIEVSAAASDFRSNDLGCLVDLLEVALAAHCEKLEQARAPHAQAREFAKLVDEMIAGADARAIG